MNTITWNTSNIERSIFNIIEDEPNGIDVNTLYIATMSCLSFDIFRSIVQTMERGRLISRSGSRYYRSM